MKYTDNQCEPIARDLPNLMDFHRDLFIAWNNTILHQENTAVNITIDFLYSEI